MVLRVRGGRHPHEVALLIACCLIGTLGTMLFRYIASPAIQALPYPYGYMLYAGVALLSGVALTGALWRSLVGSLVERAGLLGLGFFLLTYAFVVIATTGTRGLAFSIFVAVFSASNFVRVWQIAKEIEQQQALEVILKDGASHELDQ